MAKKYFVAPYLKVVRVHNDIIATSTLTADSGSSNVSGIYAPDREDWEEEGWE